MSLVSSTHDIWTRTQIHGPVYKKQGYERKTAYYSPTYRRDASPLLDHSAAVIDHVEAYSTGGAHSFENFVTACNKCNMRKSTQKAEDIVKQQYGKPVKGRFGEPRYWDGLASMFLVLAGENPAVLVGAERKWYEALRKFLAEETQNNEIT